jgi:hypothetical protein
MWHLGKSWIDCSANTNVMTQIECRFQNKRGKKTSSQIGEFGK